MAEIITPTRKEFATFLNSQRLIRAFEELFDRIPESAAMIEESSVASKANQAIGTSVSNGIRSKSNNVLLWLSED